MKKIVVLILSLFICLNFVYAEENIENNEDLIVSYEKEDTVENDDKTNEEDNVITNDIPLDNLENKELVINEDTSKKEKGTKLIASGFIALIILIIAFSVVKKNNYIRMEARKLKESEKE